MKDPDFGWRESPEMMEEITSVWPPMELRRSEMSSLVSSLSLFTGSLLMDLFCLICSNFLFKSKCLADDIADPR